MTLGLVLSSQCASAMFKCSTPDGKISYQEQPCVAEAKNLPINAQTHQITQSDSIKKNYQIDNIQIHDPTIFYQKSSSGSISIWLSPKLIKNNNGHKVKVRIKTSIKAASGNILYTANDSKDIDPNGTSTEKILLAVVNKNNIATKFDPALATHATITYKVSDENQEKHIDRVVIQK